MLARMGQREWALVAIVAALIVGVLFYFFAIQPMQSQIATLNQQINLLTFQRNQGLAAQRALPELQATIASLEAQKQVFQKKNK
jgi:type IV pilus assembly protein PilO